MSRAEPRRSSIFQGPSTTPSEGLIFRTSLTESAGSVQVERGIPFIPATPVTEPVAMEVPPAPRKMQVGGEVREELARIEGEREGLVAPPPTPKTGFLPIVQPSLSASEGYSETLQVIPESIQVPVQVRPPLPKTYLIACDMNKDQPQFIKEMVQWTIQTLLNPEDLVKILISGELQGPETKEGYISDIITNESFSQDKEKVVGKYPLLTEMVETSGLLNHQFQIEIRRSESLGWSLRSEFQWPHVNEQMIVIVPSYQHSGHIGESFDGFILKAAPCPVVEFKQ